MNKIKLTAFSVLISLSAIAGNRDRTGQSGAGELLFNPWGASSGLFGLNGAQVTGIEAMKCNIAGLAKTTNNEIGFAHTRFLGGTGMSLSNVGLAYGLGEVGVLGVNIMSFGFGDITRTQENAPEGGLGTYKPSFINMSVGLGHTFSKNMSAGLNVTYVNETIENIKASAVGFDAGIQYTNGKNDNLHIGITLRNVGTNMRFSGDGFSFQGTSPDYAKDYTVQSRSDKFGLPTQLNIAVANDFYLDENGKTEATDPSKTTASSKGMHRLTPMVSFVSNAYFNDWIGLGVEYAYKEKFMARVAYRYETDIFSQTENTTIYSGLSIGTSFKSKFSDNEKAPEVAVDYAFKQTRFSGGAHTIGLRLFLGKK